MQISINDIQPHVYAVNEFTSCATTPNNEAAKNTYTYRFMLLIQGSSTLILSGQRLNFLTGSLLFLRPGDSYQILNSDGDFTVCNVFFDFMKTRTSERFLRTHQLDSMFDRSLCSELVHFSDTKIYSGPRIFNENFKYISDFLNLRKIFASHGRFHDKMVDLQLNQLLVSFAEQELQPNDGYMKLAYDVVEYIRQNCTFPLTGEELSERFGYHPNYLNHVVTEYTGMSLHRCVPNSKIQNACELLLDTDMTLSELAQHLSFSDSSHFSKVFKRLIGCSPGKYRIH